MSLPDHLHRFVLSSTQITISHWRCYPLPPQLVPLLCPSSPGPTTSRANLQTCNCAMMQTQMSHFPICPSENRSSRKPSCSEVGLFVVSVCSASLPLLSPVPFPRKRPPLSCLTVDAYTKEHIICPCQAARLSRRFKACRGFPNCQAMCKSKAPPDVGQG